MLPVSGVSWFHTPFGSAPVGELRHSVQPVPARAAHRPDRPVRAELRPGGLPLRPRPGIVHDGAHRGIGGGSRLTEEAVCQSDGRPVERVSERSGHLELGVGRLAFVITPVSQ